MKLLIVGYGQRGHMGSYLVSAARQLGLSYAIVDAAQSQARSRAMRSVYWHCLDKRPGRLRRFGEQVLDACAAWRPDVVLTTGCAPLDLSHLKRLSGLGIKLINYSTDDPWNPAHRAEWFLMALPAYDAVFTVRQANIEDFRRCGVRSIHYLPFGYDPEVHRPWPDLEPAGAASDMLFVGGCDADRLPLIGALIDEGVDLALFGGYWSRHSNTRDRWRGLADQDTIRAASASAQICLCLVRRANRDGNTMRSFEAAAIGGCILAEDTPDHRELFGPHDHAVRYFESLPELIRQTKLLLGNGDIRNRLSCTLRETFDRGRHTYAARLRTMLRAFDTSHALCIPNDPVPGMIEDRR